VPGFRIIVTLEGCTTVNVIRQEQPAPVAVIVTDPALSSAVNLTVVWLPEFGVSVPPPLVIAHVAGAGFTVRSTSSPTPMVVLVTLVGEVATVWDVMVQVQRLDEDDELEELLDDDDEDDDDDDDELEELLDDDDELAVQGTAGSPTLP
jgi:hypothetical protein